jgi:hypothetical protein
MKIHIVEELQMLSKVVFFEHGQLVLLPNEERLLRLSSILDNELRMRLIERHEVYISIYKNDAVRVEIELLKQRIVGRIYELEPENAFGDDIGELIWAMRREDFLSGYDAHIFGWDSTGISERKLYDYSRDMVQIHTAQAAGHVSDRQKKQISQIASVPKIDLGTPLSDKFNAEVCRFATCDPVIFKLVQSLAELLRKLTLHEFKAKGSCLRTSQCKYCGSSFEWETGRGKRQPPTCSAPKCHNQHRYRMRKAAATRPEEE